MGKIILFRTGVFYGKVREWILPTDIKNERSKKMKKLLSVILALSMIMSLFCAIPASAEAIVAWPYFFEDCEDAS